MDISQEIKSFTPIDIEKLSQENNVSEKIIESVKTYNKAIENLRTGSEDIAMIELKKVVSHNPDFYEAINLLGLCYAYTNQIDKAEELFGRVVKSESDVIKAADYLKFIGRMDYSSTKSANKVKRNKTINKQANNPEKTAKPVVQKNYKDDVPTEYILFKKIGAQLRKPYVAIVINVLSAVFLIIATVLFLSAPKEIDNSAAVDSAVNTDLNDNYDKVVAENSSLKTQLNQVNAKLANLQLETDLTQVSVLYGQKKYEQAADKLIALPVDQMDNALKEKYNSIKEDVVLKAANQLTSEGSKLYDGKKYLDAIKKLEKVFVLGDKWTFGDKALYILGKSYVEVKDLQKGAAAYQKLIDEYPKSGYIQYAKSRLKAIK